MPENTSTPVVSGYAVGTGPARRVATAERVEVCKTVLRCAEVVLDCSVDVVVLGAEGKERQ